MKKNYLHVFLVILLLLVFGASALQSQPAHPKRELRAAWVATVKNIDWPSRSGLDTETLKSEMIELLDLFESHGLNAVVFQIRPAADALYDSPYEPWSEWLTGVQGQAPSPYLDPLDFMTQECHKRGMELHAWFNPYRAIVDTARDAPLAYNHIQNRYPNWLLQYGKNTYFDPGLPEARDYVVNIIMDVVRRYDIDAVHFDDYFYPYKISGVPFPDTATYAEFGRGLGLEDWRRDNVNRLVKTLSDSIHAAKAWMKFGISPFGVWRNSDVDPKGSNTQAGQTCYDDLYADVKMWADSQWIDYLAPQAYFSQGYPPADYSEIVNWWSHYAYGRHVYVGQALYKINNNKDQNWSRPNEIPNQIRFNRQLRQVKGSMYFSAKTLKKNPLGITDSLQNGVYRYPALPPPMDWLEGQTPMAPPKMKMKSIKNGMALRWDPSKLPTGTKYLAIYRFPKGKAGSIEDPLHLIEVVGVNNKEWVDDHPKFLKRFTYVITGLDRLFHESPRAPSLTRRRWSGLFGGKKKGGE